MFSFSKILKYIYLFIKPYRLAFFSLFLFVVSRIFFANIVTGYVYKNIIDLFNNSFLPINTRYEIGLLFLLAISFSFIISMIMTRYGEYVQMRFSTKTIKNIYDYSFEKLSFHSYDFYINTFTGKLVAKTKRLVKAFEIIVSIAIYNFWSIIIVIFGSIFALYFQSKILALYFIIWCLIYAGLILLFVQKKIKVDIEKAKADSHLTGILADSITNFLNIKIFSAFQKEFSYFKKTTTYLKDTIYRASIFTLKRHILQTFLMITFHIFILYTMMNLWKMGEITVGVFVMAYIYLLAIIDRIWDLSSGITNFMEALTDTKEMIDIFEKEIDVKDKENAEICRIKDGEIEFKNVYFSYTKGIYVLDDFNLKIKKGEKVGIVGHSGSGKSTITKLLLRFVDVDMGEILIDGQDIRNVKQDDLRNAISFVPQESILFHRSIKENIGYAKDKASEEEIIESARKAYADDFIQKLSYGYDTTVGERGIKLSGGERQRIAIARAILRLSPILILDEATSSLDSESEKYIEEALNELMKNKTTLVIAHRLSTVLKMDRIIVIEDGKIIEEGNHKELLEKNGKYKILWNHQTGGFLE